MKLTLKKGISALVISIIFVALIVAPVCNAGVKTINTVSKKKALEIKEKMDDCKSTQGTEYWALLVAVGVYYKHPKQNRPSMLEAVDDLYDVLIDSPQWQPDHIHMLKGSQATCRNLIEELIWLIQNEDSDDMSLVYITTHGSPLKDKNGRPVDLPPKDEADGADEILVMYYGFEKWYGFIWDDLLNFFLSLLQSQGVCVIVDSCYSGGFNDLPMFDETMLEEYIAESFTQDLIEDVSFFSNQCNDDQVFDEGMPEGYATESSIQGLGEDGGCFSTGFNDDQVVTEIMPWEYTAESFTQGLVEDLAAQGRVVLMSCEEDTTSSGSRFSNFLIEGFWGWADLFGNGNGINSAEESFSYADWWVNFVSGGSQDPTILDLYPGEFTVTYT